MTKRLLVILILLVILAGCSLGKKPLDKPADDGSYLYNNKLLGFSLTLPKEFQYYQTQRKDAHGYKDLEIFVPTSDTKYIQEVEGYGKPIVVRVYEKDAWKEAIKDESIKNTYQVIRETYSSVYTIKFWDAVPSDWSGKWTEEMKKGIIAQFSVN